ncbi:MAG: S8 family serine peptidase [Bacteroidota bacterium]
MKGIVNTYLNLRTGAPRVNAENPSYYKPGDEVNIVDSITGDRYRDNDVWLQLNNNGYVWSGGVNGFQNIVHKESKTTINPSVYPKQIRLFGIDHLWMKSMGEDIDIAILDTGVDKNHFNIKHAVVSTKNFLEKDDTNVEDYCGHGTHCAGIIAARGMNNIFGVAPKANLHIGKITHFVSDGISNSILLNALDHYINKVDIISLSGGLREEDVELSEKILASKSTKTIIVAAIGNDKDRQMGDYPAENNECISVGAIGLNEIDEIFLWEKTIRSQKLKICAPGYKITSTDLYNQHKERTGTSMACPYVAGLFALLHGTFKPLSKTELMSKFSSLLHTYKADNYSYKVFSAI